MIPSPLKNIFSSKSLFYGHQVCCHGITNHLSSSGIVEWMWRAGIHIYSIIGGKYLSSTKHTPEGRMGGREGDSFTSNRGLWIHIKIAFIRLQNVFQCVEWVRINTNFAFVFFLFVKCRIVVCGLFCAHLLGIIFSYTSWTSFVSRYFNKWACYCVTRAPLSYPIRSWVALSSKVVSE